MEKIKVWFAGYSKGLRTIFTRNAILAILLNIINLYSNNVKSGFRTLVGSNEIGMTATAIGAAISLFTFVGLLIRTPSGSITDTLRKKLKYVLTVALVLKAVIWMFFAVVKTPIQYYILFVADAVVWSFLGVAIPVVLAVSVDRRAMGTGWALMNGITMVINASARPTGISLYKNSGILTAAAVAGALSIVGAVLTLLLDNKKLTEGADAMNKKPGGKKKGVLSGLNIKLLPIALCSALPTMLTTMQTNFFQIFATETGINYLAAETLGGSVGGVVNMVIGFFCDIIDPFILVVFSLVCQTIVPFLWTMTGAASVFSLGVFLYYVTRFYSTCLRILAMKAISSEEQGSLAATFMFSSDLVSVIAATVIGACVDGVGYTGTFYVLGVALAVITVAFIVVYKTSLQKMIREKTALLGAQEAQGAGASK